MFRPFQRSIQCGVVSVTRRPLTSTTASLHTTIPRKLTNTLTLRPHTPVKSSKSHRIPIITTQSRYNGDYNRPFSVYKGLLDAFLIGSRHNYARPSVTYAAGLGNTTLRHTRLHTEDYIHPIPAHRAIPLYIISLLDKRPGWFLLTLIIGLAIKTIVEYRRSNELYDRATESIFAYKAKNFLIKQGEKVFLETLLIMFHEGVIEPMNRPGETTGDAEARFIGEINAMLAEIERHRDFRLSNIPLNFFEVHQQQQENSWSYRLELLLKKPFFTPIHKHAQNYLEILAQYNTPHDIRQKHAGAFELDPKSYGLGSNPHEKLDSSGVGAIYGLFYPLLTRYHTAPTELSVQATPSTMEHSVRHRYAPLSKLVGRVQDNLWTSSRSDQFQLDHRNRHDPDVAVAFADNPRGANISYTPDQHWDSDVEKEIYNSYYLQRACNLVKRVNDVHSLIHSQPFVMELNPSPYDLIKSYLHKPYRVLMAGMWNTQTDTYAPGDNPLFRYYYQRYNLVPYLNSLQYEMQELLLLRQRVVRLGRAVGIDQDLETLSHATLDLLDPFSPANQSRFVEKELKRLTVDIGEKVLTLGPSGHVNTAILPPHMQIPNDPKLNPYDSSRYIAGASHSVESLSLLNPNEKIIVFDENTSSTVNMAAKYKPKLPAPRTPGTMGLYKPINVANLADYITNKTYNIKGLNIIVDSLYHAQLSQTPKFYPCLGVHAEPIQQERYYTRALFNPLDNAIGNTDDEKYVRGILGAIDTILLRNAGEYQRWIYLVPDDSKTLWDYVKDKLMIKKLTGVLFGDALSAESLKNLREDGYLQRDKLPSQLAKGYTGTWAPFTTKEEEVATKPVYYQTQVAERTWTETFYSWMGWDYNHKPTMEEQKYYLGADMKEAKELPWGTPTDTMFVQDTGMQNQETPEEQLKRIQTAQDAPPAPREWYENPSINPYLYVK